MENYFRQLAHLFEQIGQRRFEVLISSDNTGKVEGFCEELIEASLPTEMTVGGRTYEILGFLKGKEKHVSGYTMVDRAKEMNAHLGEDDGRHILKHQNEIPVELRGNVLFVFTDWRNYNGSSIFCVGWFDGRWVEDWFWLIIDWLNKCRVLCLKSTS